jgi:hypothetical protein
MAATALLVEDERKLRELDLVILDLGLPQIVQAVKGAGYRLGLARDV